MKYLCSIFLISVFWACSDSNHAIVPSFYHWQTNFDLDSSQSKTLTRLNVEKLYVKYFDVKWLKNPVIYITTDVFTNLDSTKIKLLSKNIADKIKQLHPTNSFTEIKIDCGWMPSIKDKYFYFLESVKSHFKNTIFSATVPLYQY